MNIEEIRADVFRLFDIRVDRDDPIWAFLYANREIIKDLEEIMELNKKETRDHHRNIKIELEEFKKTSKDSVQSSIEQFDFRIDEFNKDIARLEKLNENAINLKARFKTDLRKIYDEKTENLGNLFDNNIVAIEERINNIIEAVDYTRFSKNIEKEVENIVKKSLQEVRAGVSINNRVMENLKEINEANESTIRRLHSQISTLTTLGIFQTLLFGASATFIALVYFSQGTLKFSSVVETKKETSHILSEMQ